MPCETKAERAARFWSHVDRSGGPDACWPWQGERRSETSPYGRFGLAPKRRAKRVSAHRFAYELVKGKIPDGHVLLHSCDNPPCCNPDHLAPGPQLRNIRDMIAKGRAGWQSRKRELTCEPVTATTHEPTTETCDDIPF